jgi:hypothetical protein
MQIRKGGGKRIRPISFKNQHALALFWVLGRLGCRTLAGFKGAGFDFRCATRSNDGTEKEIFISSRSVVSIDARYWETRKRAIVSCASSPKSAIDMCSG